MPGGSNTVALAEFPAAGMLRHICRRGAALWLACPVPVFARSVPPVVRRVARVLGLEPLGHLHLGGL